MEVLCTCDENYLPHAAAMLCSLLAHNRVSRVHFFHNSITKSELDKLIALVKEYGSEIKSYELELSDFEGLQLDKWATAAVYFRLFAPRFLPEDLDRILYLDTDLIVRHSLLELWNTDVTEYALAAVPHNADEDPLFEYLGLPKGVPCFNSGVLLINLKYWKEHDVGANAVAFVRDHPERIQYWDQDALNATLIGRWLSLPTTWNYRCWWDQTVKDPDIFHFAGANKPWHWTHRNPFKREYRDYRNKTPWPYEIEDLPSLRRRIWYYALLISSFVLPEAARRRIRPRLPGVPVWW
jgi:lipopolysaccharide biosynthesis glycosyltransferase